MCDLHTKLCGCGNHTSGVKDNQRGCHTLRLEIHTSEFTVYLLEINLKLAMACHENGNIIVANTVDLSELAVVQCDSHNVFDI